MKRSRGVRNAGSRTRQIAPLAVSSSLFNSYKRKTEVKLIKFIKHPVWAKFVCVCARVLVRVTKSLPCFAAAGIKLFSAMYICFCYTINYIGLHTIKIVSMGYLRVSCVCKIERDREERGIDRQTETKNMAYTNDGKRNLRPCFPLHTQALPFTHTRTYTQQIGCLHMSEYYIFVATISFHHFKSHFTISRSSCTNLQLSRTEINTVCFHFLGYNKNKCWEFLRTEHPS